MQKIIVNKSRENPYVMVLRNFLSDSRISWKAKGLFAYLLSKPENWVVRENDLINQSTDGRESVRAGIKELIKFGYVVKVQHRENGKYGTVEWILHESPEIIENTDTPPQTENPSTAIESTENHPHSNKDLLVKPIDSKKQQQAAEEIVVVPSEPEKDEELPKGITGKLMTTLRKSYDEPVIQRQLANLRKAMTTQKIKNPSGWLRSALAQDYDIATETNTAALAFNYVPVMDEPEQSTPDKDLHSFLRSLPNLSQFAQI